MGWGHLLGLLASLAGIGYAVWCMRWVLRQPCGAPPLQPPFNAIREAAHVFFITQYRAIAVVGVILFIVLWVAPGFGGLTALGFAVGGLCSAVAGAVGMAVAVRANVRTAAAAATDGLSRALQVAIRSGAVTGFLVGALALSSVSAFYLLLWALNDQWAGGPQAPARPGLRRLADQYLRPARRRHLHQGGGRGCRPGGQDRARHPRG